MLMLMWTAGLIRNETGVALFACARAAYHAVGATYRDPRARGETRDITVLTRVTNRAPPPRPVCGRSPDAPKRPFGRPRRAQSPPGPRFGPDSAPKGALRGAFGAPQAPWASPPLCVRAGARARECARAGMSPHVWARKCARAHAWRASVRVRKSLRAPPPDLRPPASPGGSSGGCARRRRRGASTRGEHARKVAEDGAAAAAGVGWGACGGAARGAGARAAVCTWVGALDLCSRTSSTRALTCFLARVQATGRDGMQCHRVGGAADSASPSPITRRPRRRRPKGSMPRRCARKRPPRARIERELGQGGRSCGAAAVHGSVLVLSLLPLCEDDRRPTRSSLTGRSP
eukprot:scaffold1422_cov297-Prasinococcus_capsulatus_cf.AAC.4